MMVVMAVMAAGLHLNATLSDLRLFVKLSALILGAFARFAPASFNRGLRQVPAGMKMDQCGG